MKQMEETWCCWRTLVPGDGGFGYSSGFTGQFNSLSKLCCAVCQNFIKIRGTCKEGLIMKMHFLKVYTHLKCMRVCVSHSLHAGMAYLCCSSLRSLSHEFLMIIVRACRVYFLTESSRSCQISKALSSPSTVSLTSMLFNCNRMESLENANQLLIRKDRRKESLKEKL